MSLDATTALVAASGLHLGFQAVVTVVVYPALGSTEPREWARVHADHSRRISYVVAPLYLLVAASCVWVLADGPYSLAAAVALAGHAVAAGTTALVAAPAHGRLGRSGHDVAGIGRLLAADRVRLAATVVAFVASLAA